MTVTFNPFRIYDFSIPRPTLVPFLRVVQAKLLPIHIKCAPESEDVPFVALKMDTGIRYQRAALNNIENLFLNSAETPNEI